MRFQFFSSNNLTKKMSIANYGILQPYCFRNFPSNQHFTLKLIWRKKCQFKIMEFYCHTVFANFRQINILLWNWFDEKNINLKLRNFTATLFSQIFRQINVLLWNWFAKKNFNRNLQNFTAATVHCFRKFSVKSTFYLEIDLTKQMAIGNSSIQRYSLKLI